MSRIFRYQLAITGEQKISLPSWHTILSVAPARHGYHIDMWAQVRSNHIYRDRTFRIFGTGHPIPDDLSMNFVGTAVMPDELVWHVFIDVTNR